MLTQGEPKNNIVAALMIGRLSADSLRKKEDEFVQLYSSKHDN